MAGPAENEARSLGRYKLELIVKIPCHSEGALVATEESHNFVVETLRYRSHRPEAVSLREGDIFEMACNKLTIKCKRMGHNASRFSLEAL
jgi:hypothetical protein